MMLDCCEKTPLSVREKRKRMKLCERAIVVKHLFFLPRIFILLNTKRKQCFIGAILELNIFVQFFIAHVLRVGL
jgi:hypothetical protein